MFPGKKIAAACLAVAAGLVGLGQAGVASAQTGGSVAYSYKTVMFGFYVQSGKLHTVAAPGEANPSAGFGTQLTGISADGTLVGNAFPAGEPIYAFSLADGTYSMIKDPNQVGTTDLDGTAVNSVSSTGVVAGGYSYTEGTSTVGGLVTAFIATLTTTSPSQPIVEHLRQAGVGRARLPERAIVSVVSVVAVVAFRASQRTSLGRDEGAAAVAYL